MDTETIGPRRELHKNAYNLEETNGTPLFLPLWLSFSEAVLAHLVGSKHSKRALWQNGSAEVQ